MPGSRPLVVRLERLQQELRSRHRKGKHRPVLLGAVEPPQQQRGKPQQRPRGRKAARNRYGRWVTLPRPAHTVAGKTTEQWQVNAVSMTMMAVTLQRSVVSAKETIARQASDIGALQDKTAKLKKQVTDTSHKLKEQVRAAEAKVVAAEARALLAEEEAATTRSRHSTDLATATQTVTALELRAERAVASEAYYYAELERVEEEAEAASSRYTVGLATVVHQLARAVASEEYYRAELERVEAELWTTDSGGDEANAD